MKKIYLLCAGIFTMCFSQNAFSVDFSEKFYGKAYIGIGYNKQIYTGLWKENYIDPYESLGSFGIIPHTKNHTIDINIGNNIYFRMNSYLRPFIGAEIVGKIPIKDHGMWAGYIIRLYERFVVHGKIGLKINVVKGWFAVSPYYIVGANVYQIKSDLEKYKDVDLSTGAGMEFLVKERVSLSFEYRRTRNYFGVLCEKLETNNFATRLSVYFL